MRHRGWFLLFLGACEDHDVPPAPGPTPTPTATPATDAAPPLSLVMTPDVAVSHLCARVTLARSDGAAFPAGEIAIATDPSTRTFDAETDCAGASTPVRVLAGATPKTFFVRIVWNQTPSSPSESAAFALGQPAGPSNLTSRSRIAGGVSASSLHEPDEPRCDDALRRRRRQLPHPPHGPLTTSPPPRGP